MTREWLFDDRRDAGAQLAQQLAKFQDNVLVLGIPRGGVSVAAEVARVLGAELDVIVARKLGAPFSPELAIGAVTADGGRYLNVDAIAAYDIAGEYISEETHAQQMEAGRREARFRAGRPAPEVRGRTVIIVDDGLATGATMLAAVRSVRNGAPARVVVAVPVGSPSACAMLRPEVDELVCLSVPPWFGAVGEFYRDFRQIDDDEVIALLGAATVARSAVVT